MLISFSVGNYRSFGEEQTLNMVASNKLTEHPSHLVPIGNTGKSVLRSAVIYGANAAGKSNLVRAMHHAVGLVVGGPTRLLKASDPFSFDGKYADKPSSFEFRFLVGDRIFVYGFDVTGRTITGEWLALSDGQKDVVIFERDEQGMATVGSHAKSALSEDERTVTTLDVLTKLKLSPDQLLLNRAVDLPEEVQGTTLQSVINWLAKELVILHPNYRDMGILERLARDEDFREFATGFLKNVGTGVESLRIVDVERNANIFESQFFEPNGRNIRLPNPSSYGRTSDTEIRRKSGDPSRVITRTLFAKHSSRDDQAQLPFSEESDGTQQLLHLAPVLSALHDDARVVVIDELDRSLHPMVCWEFIRFFSETAAGAHKQLIVTTHEAHLLNQELLRRDEYWFVEKDERQQSRLVSLSEFKIRNDLQVEKGYLQGRFGAIPVIGAMDELEKLLQQPSIPESDDATQTSSP